MIIRKLKQKIFKTETGLLPITRDDRDLGAFNFWGLTDIFYKPKYDKKELVLPFQAKSQYYNSCGWSGEAGMKEIDEKVELSQRGFSIIGMSLGYISGDGFSNLRNNEKALKSMGIPEKKYMVESHTDWRDYFNTKYLTKQVRDNAYIHRSKSFLRLYNINEVYKAIDDDRPVSFGIDWYSGFNIRGGFSSPWIISGPSGWRVGGHKMFIYGYNAKQKLFKVRNSFGNTWGEHGDLYIREKWLAGQIKKYGAFINYDIDVDITRWIMENANTLVKMRGRSTVWYIDGGKKRPFMNFKDFSKFLSLVPIFSYPKIDDNISIINKKILDKVPNGKPMLR